MSSVNRDFFQLFVLPSDTKSGITFSEWIELVRMAARSKRPEKNEEESATLPALMVEGDCVLDFCLERESFDSG